MEDKYQAILNAQDDMAVLKLELDEHVRLAHGGDIEHCDLWCWPRTVRRTIGAMDGSERWVLQLVMLKEWYWRRAAMEPWLADDDPEPDVSG